MPLHLYCISPDMRPKDKEYGSEMYECLSCGVRVDTPESRVCPDCSGELWHLGRPRDL